MPQVKKPARRRVTRPVRAVELEITDSLVRNMLHDTRYLNAFPFLKRAKQKAMVKGCGSCGAAKMKLTAPNLAVLRRNLANMSAEKKVRLKHLLGAKKVTVKYPKLHGGKVVKHF